MPKITFQGRLAVPHETVLANIAHAKGLGLPYLQKPSPKEIAFHDRPLAVVGGGHSAKDHLDELRSWPGEIWAINGACAWLRECGIESTVFTLDPLPVIAQVVKGATKAILCSRCDPGVFEALKGADVRLFDVFTDSPGGVWASCGTVLSAFDLATDLGFKDVCFFGCEGSYEGSTHLYMDDPQDFRFVVQCGGREYLTLPEMYEATRQMAVFLRTFPHNFREKSGGLLRAMIENEEHDIVKVSRGLLAGLKPLKEAA